jgi:hypothetical protein
MDATSFHFTMTMPGDDRLADTVRDLTAHAARYAQLSDGDVKALVADVLAAAATSSTAAGGGHGMVEIRFERTVDRLNVVIEWEGHAPSEPQASRSSDSTSVQWSHHGRRQRCLVSHRT